MKDIIEKYRGNYIAEMRKIVGHAPLRTIGCGVIIENDKGEILLQKRRDNGLWAIIGGSMEIGEKFIETAKREAFEEAGIEINDLTLFCIYSGEDRIITYPNGDICCGTGIIFRLSDIFTTIPVNLPHLSTFAYFRQGTSGHIQAVHLLPKHLRHIQSREWFSISSQFPYVLCYNVLCDFVSLIFSLIRVCNALWEDITQGK